MGSLFSCLNCSCLNCSDTQDRPGILLTSEERVDALNAITGTKSGVGDTNADRREETQNDTLETAGSTMTHHEKSSGGYNGISHNANNGSAFDPITSNSHSVDTEQPQVLPN